MHKRHLNQTKSRYIDEKSDIPVDIEHIEVLFNTFDVPIPQKAPEAKKEKDREEKREYREDQH